MAKTGRKAVITEEQLFDEIVNNKKSVRQISQEYGLDPHYVGKKVKKYNIPPTYLDYVMTIDYLRDNYITKKKSISDIASDVGCCHEAVKNRLLKYNFKIRTLSESVILAADKSYGDILGCVWAHIKSGFNKREKITDFSISIEYAWDLFLKQDRQCSLSGFKLRFPKNALEEKKWISNGIIRPY